MSEMIMNCRVLAMSVWSVLTNNSESSVEQFQQQWSWEEKEFSTNIKKLQQIAWVGALRLRRLGDIPTPLIMLEQVLSQMFCGKKSRLSSYWSKRSIINTPIFAAYYATGHVINISRFLHKTHEESLIKSMA